jgi:hypothetical protein
MLDQIKKAVADIANPEATTKLLGAAEVRSEYIEVYLSPKIYNFEDIRILHFCF